MITLIKVKRLTVMTTTMTTMQVKKNCRLPRSQRLNPVILLRVILPFLLRDCETRYVF